MIMTNMKHNQDGGGVVDGLIEKKAFDRQYFGSCIGNAMKVRQELGVLGR
jgi:hypothetical protein